MTKFRKITCGLSLENRAGERPSAAGAAALATASRIAQDDGANLHLITALELDDIAVEVMARAHRVGDASPLENAKARLDEMAAASRAAGVRTTTEAVATAPAAALLEDAARNRRDLIVVGTRERGAVARNLLGSTALTLLRRAPQTVWVARSPFGEKPPVVLCAIDLGDMAPRILRAAAHAASRPGGALHVLHVVNFAAADVLRAGAADTAIIKSYRKERRATAETRVAALVKETLGPGTHAKVHLPDGDVDATILKTAQDLGADLVVLGSVVHSFVGAAVTGLGRTAESVLPRIRASLLVVKPESPKK